MESRVVRGARRVAGALWATARAVPPRTLIAGTLVAVIIVSVLLLVPVPSALQLRDWATSVGPWFPLVFLATYIVATVFPIPRTAFTLAAGLLFGPSLGISLAVLASTCSAVIAFHLVRATGWRLGRVLRHPRVEQVEQRLERRGWPVVVSLRLIPAVPFSVLNYAAGASSVRAVPYSVASFVGLVPGTAAVVILGDALTGSIDPLLVAVSCGTALIGLAGLVFEARRRPGTDAEVTDRAQAPQRS